MVLVAVGVILDEKVASFFVTVLAYEPSRRFREEENYQGYKAGADHLQPQWEAPFQGRVAEMLVRAVDCRSSEDRALCAELETRRATQRAMLTK